MSYLKWTDTYSVGMPEIDEQHRRLFALVNGLHESMKTGRNRDLPGTIDALIDYTDYHFKTEELILRSCHYPRYTEHKEMHESLRRTARSMKEAVESGNTPTAVEVLLVLANWLNRHVLDEDRNYQACIPAP